MMCEAEKYVAENAERYIATFAKLSAAGYAALDAQGEYYIGNGYYTFNLKDDEISTGTIINFPIIQDNRIVLILLVFNVDGEWFCNATTSGIDLLNEYGYITSIPYIVYTVDGKYLVTEDEVISFENYDICTEDFTAYQLAKLHHNYMHKLCDVVNKIDSVYELRYLGLESEQFEANSVSTVEGFSIYTDTNKLLQMENRMVSQRWFDGQQKELCWAATAATIIRYMTQTSNIWAYTIAMELGISPNNGGTMYDIYDAMTRHMNKTQMDNYQVLDRDADSITEVYHNINNRFPIAMGTIYSTVDGNTGHVVTIIGYDGNILIYWDSKTEEVLTTEYKPGRTYIIVEEENQEGNICENIYKWRCSVMIPLK